MTTQVHVNGLAVEIEAIGDGVLRISHDGGQMHALAGPNTEGRHSYLVHPCQRLQWQYWSGLLPPSERVSAELAANAPRPWWSLTAGERGGARE